MTKTQSDTFFDRKEIDDDDVQKSAHFTYRDGFRIGFGFFIGFAAAGLILLTVVWLVSAVVRLF